MRLSQMTDAGLAAELERQQKVQAHHAPSSQMWLSAARIIHHVSSELQARRRAKACPEEPRP